ncbi:MAG TPA: CvpA family protein [Chitinophagaceae bacterium]|jgi:membrane protein required for colicin V production|nr:CvpA family protein [Chitinophagaceae bacterium]
MILDSILIILAIIAFIRGWSKGFLWAICSFLAILLGIIIALKLSNIVSEYLFVQQIITSKYTLLISFILLFLGTLFLFRMLVKFVEAILDKLFLGWVNKLAGGLLYSFFVVFILSTFCWLANQISLLKPTMKEDSKSYVYIEPIAPKTIEIVSTYLPYCKDLIKKTQAHLEEVSK